MEVVKLLGNGSFFVDGCVNVNRRNADIHALL